MYIHTIEVKLNYLTHAPKWTKETYSIVGMDEYDFRIRHEEGNLKWCEKTTVKNEYWYSHDVAGNFPATFEEVNNYANWISEIGDIEFSNKPINNGAKFAPLKFDQFCQHGNSDSYCEKTTCKRERRRRESIAANYACFVEFLAPMPDVVGFGFALGILLSRTVRHIAEFIEAGKRVILLARDMEAVYYALCSMGYGHSVLYLRGVNRDVARKLSTAEQGEDYLQSIGFNPNTDVMIDSGFAGSIPRAFGIEADNCYLMSADHDSGYQELNHIELGGSSTWRSIIIKLEHAPKLEVTYWRGKPSFEINPPELKQFRPHYVAMVNAIAKGIKWGIDNVLTEDVVSSALEVVTSTKTKDS